MSHEQMDEQLEQITRSNSDARRSRENSRRRLLTQRAEAEYAAEKEKLHKKQRFVYRSAFHLSALFCAGFFIFGLSELYEMHVVSGLCLCAASLCMGIVGNIFDKLGGE